MGSNQYSDRQGKIEELQREVADIDRKIARCNPSRDSMEVQNGYLPAPVIAQLDNYKLKRAEAVRKIKGLKQKMGRAI